MKVTRKKKQTIGCEYGIMMVIRDQREGRREAKGFSAAAAATGSYRSHCPPSSCGDESDEKMVSKPATRFSG